MKCICSVQIYNWGLCAIAQRWSRRVWELAFFPSPLCAGFLVGTELSGLLFFGSELTPGEFSLCKIPLPSRLWCCSYYHFPQWKKKKAWKAALALGMGFQIWKLCALSTYMILGPRLSSIHNPLPKAPSVSSVSSCGFNSVCVCVHAVCVTERKKGREGEMEGRGPENTSTGPLEMRQLANKSKEKEKSGQGGERWGVAKRRRVPHLVLFFPHSFKWHLPIKEQENRVSKEVKWSIQNDIVVDPKHGPRPVWCAFWMSILTEDTAGLLRGVARMILPLYLRNYIYIYIHFSHSALSNLCDP